MDASTQSSVVDHPTVAPDKGGGIFMILLAAGFGAITWYLFDLHMGKAGDKPDTAGGVITGIALGIAVWALAAGIMRLSGKRLGRIAGVVLLVLCAVGGGIAEPRLGKAKRIADEQRAWDALQASGKTFEDYQTYERWTNNPRPGTRANRALAEAKSEAARMIKYNNRNVEAWRLLVDKCNREMRQYPGEDMRPAIDYAYDEIGKIYAASLAELDDKARASATRPAASGKPAEAPIKEDPAMRAAFRTVLERLVRADSDVVWLAFSTDSQVTAPAAGTPASPGEKLIDPGPAFARAQDDRRFRSFARSMQDTLKSAFSDQLISLRPLEPADKRDGRIVFDVKCVTRRIPGGMVLTREGKEIGTLFNIEVAWEFAIFDTNGKLLTKSASRSRPGESLQFKRSRSDPDWAAYSVMMDSAYYNYCREVTGQLGLIPPPTRGYFEFEQ
ncbi:MAG: hypothetical protein ACAI43_26615 [Phycisphaerae bacterium]|nr:hypothetical protein [Tepidisphaeraceae bacterium]